MIDWLEQHLFSCFFVKYFGVECPGCGMQRAFIALLRGDFAASFHHHPALIPFLSVILVVILHLRFNFKHGAKLIIYGFAFTVVVLLMNYIYKQSQSSLLHKMENHGQKL
jgi:hypothetical protein